jgi:hypothetical protein
LIDTQSAQAQTTCQHNKRKGKHQQRMSLHNDEQDAQRTVAQGHSNKVLGDEVHDVEVL